MPVVNGLYLRDLADEANKNITNQTNQYALDRQKVTDGRADDLYGNTQMVAQQYASGDTKGAETAAAGAANFATLDHLHAMDDKAQKTAADHADLVSRIVQPLRSIDASKDNGAARRESARPTLMANGLTKEEIDNHDFSDTGLDLAESTAMSVKDRLAQIKEAREANKMYFSPDGSGFVQGADGTPEQRYAGGDKGTRQIVTNPVTGVSSYVDVPARPGTMLGHSAPQSAPQPTGSRASKFGPIGQGGFGAIDGGFERAIEGGYADRDGASGAPVNFGINQKFNPDIDVKNLTPEKAAEIRKTRYWDQSGAANQPTPAGQAIVYDTAVNMGVSAAQRMLKETNGDPEAMLGWRDKRYHVIGANPANAAQLPGWLQRNDQLRQFAFSGEGQATQGQPAQAQAQAPAGPTVTQLTGGTGQIWKDDQRNGMVGQTNTVTGEFKPLAGQSRMTLSQKNIQDARQKLATLDNLDDALNKLEKHGNNTWATGPILGHFPANWAGGDADRYESDASTARNTIQSLTRIPGIGASSDYETKLAAALSPSRTQSKEGRAETIANARAIVAGFRASLKDALGGSQTGGQQAPAPQSNRPTRTATNPKTGQKLGLVNGQWVPM